MTARKSTYARAVRLLLLISLVFGTQEALAVAQSPTEIPAVKDGEPCKQRGQVTGTVKQQFVCVWAKTTTASGRVVGRRLVWELQTPKSSTTVGTTAVSSTTTTAALRKTCATGGECRVGDIGAGGGVVFYVPSTPQWWGRYMEAAPNRWNGQWGDIRYVSGCYGMSIPGASAVGLGSGRRNTEAIVLACPERNIAAKMADDLVLNGKSDWFLPSRDELNEMFPHRTGIGIRVAEDNQAYASSSFPNAETFWGQLFTDDSTLGNKAGQQFRPQRTSPYSYYVRPIRYGETSAEPAATTTSSSVTTSTRSVSPSTTASTIGATVSQRNAVSKAASYLRTMAFSRSGLISQLEFEGFSREDATYGVDAQNADWRAQAVKKGASYLRTMAFSRSGLISQLEFEGFSTSDATYGTDAQNADWNAQAAKKAASYLRTSAFSRSGLISQLEYEGFTRAQAEYGVNSVGL